MSLEPEIKYLNYTRLKGYLSKIITKFYFDINEILFSVHIDSITIIFYHNCISFEDLPKCDYIKKTLNDKVLVLEVL